MERLEESRNVVCGKVLNRPERVEDGNFADCRQMGKGVWKLRIDCWEGQRRLRFSTLGLQRNTGATTMPKRTPAYAPWLATKLKDPQIAQEYLKASRESPEEFLKALLRVAEAHHVSKVAEGAGRQRESTECCRREAILVLIGFGRCFE